MSISGNRVSVFDLHNKTFKKKKLNVKTPASKKNKKMLRRQRTRKGKSIN